MKSTFVLQDIVLNQIRRDHSVARFTTIDGKEILGSLRGFDHETVIVDVNHEKQVMLYKKNLLSVEPQAPVLTD